MSVNVESTKPKKVSKKGLDSAARAALIAEFADDMKALDIETLDVKAKTSVADYFVVCTGTSDTHVNAIAERVAEKLRDVGIKPARANIGRQADGWVLYDFGDVVFHVMLEEKRQFYDLEAYWKEMQPNPDLV